MPHFDKYSTLQVDIPQNHITGYLISLRYSFLNLKFILNIVYKIYTFIKPSNICF